MTSLASQVSTGVLVWCRHMLPFKCVNNWPGGVCRMCLMFDLNGRGVGCWFERVRDRSAEIIKVAFGFCWFRLRSSGIGMV